MKVEKVIHINESHSIEIGKSTWDSSEQSLRNRYDQQNGKFDPKSSSEIPRNDLILIIRESINNDLLTGAELVETLEIIINKLKRIIS
jgi:hypothetical protein